ncbi:sugar phosphate isomerase/epimerase family protein [Paraglaciecola arctica]|uniref:sugar phosphate isomerase/epimerase family protein n=1 Tax=Paraglaciecola arctica TaxID=1128911 RepID=UPI001C07DC93|nr:sugar phosphate isomerase/epimerase [Paraglaciecola arctica]MBU3006192.1 sugar phosphate isomerase/epimerase [Paraglaciecola arctica]
MNLNFHKSFWETPCNNDKALNELVKRSSDDGYQGTELFLPFFEFDAELTLKIHAQFDLNIITGIATEGDNVQAHLNSMNTQVARAIEFSPVLINSHTGRDIFSLEDNLRLFENALELEQKHKVMITHETHRYRPTFSTFDTEKILKALPELKLNLDISHWMVVHESDLSDQISRLESIFPQVHHIHARVGFEEGPQVTDPQDKIWASHLKNHVNLWQKVIDLAKTRGQKNFTITPEFGPFPYAHLQPNSQQPLTDVWAANNFMQQHLKAMLI